jgi:hypothetical protein
LYERTTFSSPDVQRLLAQVPQIEASEVAKGKILYNWTGAPDNSGKPEASRIQESPSASPDAPARVQSW